MEPPTKVTSTPLREEVSPAFCLMIAGDRQGPGEQSAILSYKVAERGVPG